MGDDDLLRASEARLWRMIEARAGPDADVAAIDRKIWQLYGDTRAVVFTDLAGFSRQVEEFGMIHFLQVIYDARRLLFPVVEQHGGVLVKAEADSFLLVFRSADDALDCCLQMQKVCEQVNQRRVPEEQVLLCVGVGYGRVLRIGDREVWGREVNAASKLGEDAARAGEILVTSAAREAATASPRRRFVEIDTVAAGATRNYRLEAAD